MSLSDMIVIDKRKEGNSMQLQGNDILKIKNACIDHTSFYRDLTSLITLLEELDENVDGENKLFKKYIIEINSHFSAIDYYRVSKIKIPVNFAQNLDRIAWLNLAISWISKQTPDLISQNLLDGLSEVVSALFSEYDEYIKLNIADQEKSKSNEDSIKAPEINIEIILR